MSSQRTNSKIQTQSEVPFQRTPLTLAEAKKKIMDFVSNRDHSKKELETKLSTQCDPEIIQQALDWAEKQNWLANSEKLTENFSEQLSRKGQGIRKINQKLKELGLQTVKADLETELEKARKLVLNKWSSSDFKDLEYGEAQKLQAKITRFLITRGYEAQVVTYILKNDLKFNNATEVEIYDEEF